MNHQEKSSSKQTDYFHIKNALLILSKWLKMFSKHWTWTWNLARSNEIVYLLLVHVMIEEEDWSKMLMKDWLFGSILKSIWHYLDRCCWWRLDQSFYCVEWKIFSCRKIIFIQYNKRKKIIIKRKEFVRFNVFLLPAYVASSRYQQFPGLIVLGPIGIY